MSFKYSTKLDVAMTIFAMVQVVLGLGYQFYQNKWYLLVLMAFITFYFVIVLIYNFAILDNIVRFNSKHSLLVLLLIFPLLVWAILKSDFMYAVLLLAQFYLIAQTIFNHNEKEA